MVLSYTAVHGTWGFDGEPSPDEWTHPGSSFTAYMREAGLTALAPFYWCGSVDGITPWGKGRRNLIWQSCGLALAERLDRDRPDVVFAHSHGGNVAIEAAAAGARIPVLVSLMTPIREDMREVARAARPHIDHWIHVYSDRTDRMQWFGEVLDRHLGIVRRAEWPGVHADEQVEIPKVGHSTILYDPSAFHVWQESGLLARVRAAAAPVLAA